MAPPTKGPLDFAQAAIIVARLGLAEFALRVWRVDRAAAMFGLRFTDERVPRHVDFAATRNEARWLHNAVRVLRRWPWDGSCLRRSLIIGWILRHHDPELVVGTRIHDGEVSAHAWVRIGTVDLDESAGDHVTFD
jgi:Transglutaminase-like superfamily